MLRSCIVQRATSSRVLAIALFTAIVVLAADPPMLVLAVDRRAERVEALARRADPDPELAAFLAEVRARTRRGDSIALVLPDRDWERYSRGYFRASYLLAGREVLPMIDERGNPSREIARARYVAAWRAPHGPNGIVWSGHEGVLVRTP